MPIPEKPSTKEYTEVISRERNSRMYDPPRLVVIASIEPTNPSNPPLAPNEKWPSEPS